MTVTLSLQEQFPTDNFDPKQPHVELAESVEPSKVKYDFCDGEGYKVDKSKTCPHQGLFLTPPPWSAMWK